MVKEPWDYDSKSHRVILNVRGDRYERRRRRKTNDAGPSLLNSPRVVVLVIILTVLVFIFLREARFVLAYNPQFKIQHIQIENTKLISQAALIQLLDLERNADSIFSVSAKELSLRLEKDPDIESVIVEKRFPDTLRIIVNERVPYAKIRLNSRDRLIDYNGIVLWRELEGNRLIPLILGVEIDKLVPGEPCPDGILENALEILRIGDQCGCRRFIEITEIDMRGLNKVVINTRERILIMMKLEDVKRQLEKLMLVLADCERRGKAIRKVDLRYKDVYVQ